MDTLLKGKWFHKTSETVKLILRIAFSALVHKRSDKLEFFSSLVILTVANQQPYRSF